MAWLLKRDDDEDPEVCDPEDEWDPTEWPHAGVWSRDPDGVGRCREHSLTPEQHGEGPRGSTIEVLDRGHILGTLGHE